jgi:uncharacterized membrane protein
MSIVIILKFIHVLSAIVAVGANVTYSFWMRAAGRDRERLVYTIQTVRRLDQRVANPAYGLLLVTGVLMVLGGLYSFETGWLATAIVLYVIVAILGIAVFAPAIRQQLAEAEADPTSPAYEAAARRSTRLGWLTTLIVLVIVFLMVTKPF